MVERASGMCRGMMLYGLFGVMDCVQMMTVGGVRVMGCPFMLSRFMVSSCGMMMLGGGFVMPGCLSVVVCSWMIGFSHNYESLSLSVERLFTRESSNCTNQRNAKLSRLVASVASPWLNSISVGAPT